MENKTVAELKEIAEELGIKVPGKGWKKCCPPKGNKADIIRAINNKQAPEWDEKDDPGPEL